jgi:predicted porin
LKFRKIFRASASAAALAFGLGSAVGFAQDAVLYGSLRLSLNAQKVGDANSQQVSDNASRFGMRGAEKLWDGMEAVYSIEYGYSAESLGTNAAIGVRHAAVGLRSAAWGTFALGALDSANPTGSPLYSQVTSIVSFAPGDAGATAISTSMMNARNRTPNSFGYMTPKMGGFTGRARYYYRGTGADESALSSFDAGLSFENGPLYVAIGYGSDSSKAGLRDNEFEDKLQVGARYNLGVVQPYVIYGIDNYIGTTRTRSEVKWWLVGARVPMGEHSIVGNYGVREVQANLIGERKRAQLAYIYKLSRRTELAAFIDRDGIDSSRTGVAIRTLGLSLRHDY